MQHILDIAMLQRNVFGNPQSAAEIRRNLDLYERQMSRLYEIHNNERLEVLAQRDEPSENIARRLQNWLRNRPTFVEQIISATNNHSGN